MQTSDNGVGVVPYFGMQMVKSNFIPILVCISSCFFFLLWKVQHVGYIIISIKYH